MMIFLSENLTFVMQKLQQHAGQGAKCIRAQNRTSGKQTQFQTLPGASALPAMPVSSLLTATDMPDGGKHASFFQRCAGLCTKSQLQ